MIREGTPIVVVGASWGGLAALNCLIGGLPADFGAPLTIVQHRSRHADNLLASLLQDVTPLPVVEIEDKEPLVPGSIYIAPANYHVLFEDGHLSLTTDPLVRFSRPSIDVTFVSAADTYLSSAIGVVLTGANDDGARGLRHIVDRGGRAVVQDPATAESPVMPNAAQRAVPEADVVPLEKLAEHLVRIVSRKGARPRKAAL
ncbi:MAG TPA: chemotaxis protein CheB [Gemmatimonadaceae bacterium]|nr:chemotaxis protein CheB [Gemmatimonadaceae bacterium]